MDVNVLNICADFLMNDEDGWDLWRSQCSASLLKQSHLELVAQGCVQVAFEYPEG